MVPVINDSVVVSGWLLLHFEKGLSFDRIKSD